MQQRVAGRARCGPRETYSSRAGTRLAGAIGLSVCFALACLVWSTPAAQAAGCANGTLDGSFASAPVGGSISTAGEVDCYELMGSSPGDVLTIGFQSSAVSNASSYWTVADGNGTPICQGYSAVERSCVLTGSASWTVSVEDRYGAGTFSYSLAVRDLSEPQGCSAALGEPSSWSFTSPRTNGSISGVLGAQCYTFTRGEGEADGAYWFKAVRTSGTLYPRWAVYGPSGAQQCSGTNSAPGERCNLLASGRYAFVVYDYQGEQAGSYLATVRRLNDPEGCSPLPSVAFGGAPSSGAIASAGEADCYTLSDLSSGDAVSVGLVAAGESEADPAWALIAGNGSTICEHRGQASGVACDLSGSPSWSLVVFDEGGRGTFSYSLAVRRLTDPQGCSSALGEPSSWSFASSRTNGSISGELGAQCYTFTRGEGEADGAYWFRTVRTSGTLEPRWRVYGTSGSSECSGSSYGASSSCRLLASGQFVLVVDDSAGRAGSYFLTSNRLNSKAGCTDLASLAFGAAAITGGIDTGGEADCHSLADATVGDWVSVGFNPASSTSSPRWSVVDGNGAVICDSYYSGSRADCRLTGSAGFSLLVYSEGSGTFSYSLAVRDLSEPQGCSAALGEPSSWSFTSPRTNGSISGVLGAQCYTFTRGEGEADGAYWFRTIRTSGNISPEWAVYAPSGARECSGHSTSIQSCRLTAYGRYVVIVDDSSIEGAGSFLLTAKRLNAPTGCAALPVRALGIAATRGTLSAAGEIDCYALPAGAGDQLKFNLSGVADELALIGPEGETQCSTTYYVCTVNGDGPFALLVYSYGGANTGSYQFEATCENVPCGQTQTAVNEVTPSRVGQGSSVTVLLRGHDLDLLEEVTLRRGEEGIVGDVQQVAADGRSVDVRFNLATASVGAWDLDASFIDGSERTAPSAVHVEGAGTPIVSLQLIGREVFRTLHKVPVSIEVSNSGNVDAVAVPVVLSGLPAGSTVEPQFQFAKAEGDLEEPTLKDAPFDSAEDTLELSDGMAIPMLVPRVPARGSVQLNFNVTVPSGGVSYSLRARAGQCLGASGSAGAGGVSSGSVTASAAAPGDPVGECANDFGAAAWKSILGLVPGVSCFYAGGDIGSALARGFVYPALGIHGFKVLSMQNVLDFGLDAAGCVVPAAKVSKATEEIVDAAGLAGDAVDATDACYGAVAEANLPQNRVTAIDPNELVGPVGVGPQHYISGDQPLQYRVFFENIAAASAPAQRIEIRDELDPSAFEASSVLFSSIRFGQTNFVLPYPEPMIDETIDLRPAQNLQVHVTAEVDGGEVNVVMQAIDPDTLEPPSDPDVGILPPNVDPPEGEGALQFTVNPSSPASGDSLSNAASIVFDDNPALQTATWSNVIDRSAPAPTVVASAGSAPLTAAVQWGGSDDASGINLWKVEVAKDGGQFEFWRSATEPGTASYEAPTAGAYSFRATAYDGAGNSGQSGLAGVSIAAASEESGSPTTPVTPTQPSAATPAAPPVTSPVAKPKKPKARKCHKGQRRKTVHGKTRCVKKKKHRYSTKHAKHRYRH